MFHADTSARHIPDKRLEAEARHIVGKCRRLVIQPRCLVRQFADNFKQYESHVDAKVRQTGMGVPA